MWIRLLVGVVLVVLAVLWLERLRGSRRGRRAAARTRSLPWDPYAVLGVVSGASPDELARAYHEQMKLYHPDRVADLGHELSWRIAKRSTSSARTPSSAGALSETLWP
jgi:DnaJ-domain-containing protein 1